MALVEKSHSIFPFGFGAGTNGRIVKSLRFLIVFGLAFFALGFGFGHGYWFVALMVGGCGPRLGLHARRFERVAAC